MLSKQNKQYINVWVIFSQLMVQNIQKWVQDEKENGEASIIYKMLSWVTGYGVVFRGSFELKEESRNLRQIWLGLRPSSSSERRLEKTGDVFFWVKISEWRKQCRSMNMLRPPVRSSLSACPVFPFLSPSHSFWPDDSRRSRSWSEGVFVGLDWFELSLKNNLNELELKCFTHVWKLLPCSSQPDSRFLPSDLPTFWSQISAEKWTSFEARSPPVCALHSLFCERPSHHWVHVLVSLKVKLFWKMFFSELTFLQWNLRNNPFMLFG